MRDHTVQEWLNAGGRICRIAETPIRDAKREIISTLRALDIPGGSIDRLIKPARTTYENETVIVVDSGIDHLLEHVHNGAPDRIITIAYYANPHDPVIYYGASIFSFDHHDHSFSRVLRKMNNQQAVDRACNNPMTVENILANVDPWLEEALGRGYLDYQRRKYLRKCIRKNGVHDLGETGDFDTMQEMLRIKAARSNAKT